MAVKESSTNQQNRRIINNQCPVTFTLEQIGGRWKPLILYNLREATLRYAQLKKTIPPITEKMLIQHLRELEADGLIKRDVKPVVPPHVEYSLTKKGESLGVLLNEMVKWGLEYRPDSKTTVTMTE
jgi:DNA-binding HxlR family transcriptional regulator